MRMRNRHLNPENYGAGLVLDARYINQSDDTAVSTWLDKSGNSRDATQGSATNQPTFQSQEVGGCGVVRFDGSDDFLEITTGMDLLKNVAGATCISVRKLNATGADRCIFIATVSGSTNSRFFIGQGGSGGNNYITLVRRLDADSSSFANDSTPKTNTNFVIQSGSVNYAGGGAGAIIAFQNGSSATSASLSSTGNTSNTNSTAIRIGRNAANIQAFNGDISLVAVFGSLLSGAVRKRLEHAAAYSFKISCN